MSKAKAHFLDDNAKCCATWTGSRQFYSNRGTKWRSSIGKGLYDPVQEELYSNTNHDSINIIVKTHQKNFGTKYIRYEHPSQAPNPDW